MKRGFPAVALLAVLVIAGCGSDKKTDTTTTATTPVFTTTATTPTTPTTTPTDTSTTTTPSGPTAKSTDGKFEVVVPDGFTERTARASESAGVKTDIVLIGPITDRFATNINVVHEAAPSDDIDAVTTAEQAGVKRVLKASSMTDTSSETVDGDDARAYDYTVDSATAGTLHQRQVITIHDGTVYIVTLSARPQSYSEALPGLSATLAGWNWL